MPFIFATKSGIGLFHESQMTIADHRLFPERPCPRLLQVRRILKFHTGSDFSSVQSLRTPVRITTSTPSCARKVYSLSCSPLAFATFRDAFNTVVTRRPVGLGTLLRRSSGTHSALSLCGLPCGRDMMSNCFKAKQFYRARTPSTATPPVTRNFRFELPPGPKA